MKVKSFLLSFLLLGVFVFTGCDDGDGYSLDKRWIGIATVENPDENPYFILELDDHTRLWTAATNFPYYKPKDGQRILADFSILSDAKEGSQYNHDIKLNDYYSILTKGIFNLTPETNDSIGTDPIHVESMWIGNGYLNVEFTYPGGQKTHFINLVTPPIAPELFQHREFRKIHLEFRHNAHEDKANYRQWGMVSFNLESLESLRTGEGEESVPIVVHWKSFDSPADRHKELIYNFNSKVEAKAFSLSHEKGEFQ